MAMRERASAPPTGPCAALKVSMASRRGSIDEGSGEC